MGKRVVYLREPDERELEADGIDPAVWVREIVKKALDERKAARVAGTKPVSKPQ
jgi:hypothetical protein